MKPGPVMVPTSPGGVERHLHEQIPLTKAMGLRVEQWDQERIVVTAPLELNHNHLGAAFGGSLAVVATLAGYGLLWLVLADGDAHVVIRRSSLEYLRPVRGMIRAICRRPDDAALAGFKLAFERTGRARIKLEVSIEEEGFECVRFEGQFVALR
jgi:thioesterase domain-containing protein